MHQTGTKKKQIKSFRAAEKLIKFVTVEKNDTFEHMNPESFRNYCLQKAGTNESFPFNETVLVMKVMSKMYALSDIEKDFAISLKCPPEQLTELTEHYPQIIPAPHFDKKHWLQITPGSELSDDFIIKLIDQSYKLVRQKLTKKEKDQLQNFNI